TELIDSMITGHKQIIEFSDNSRKRNFVFENKMMNSLEPMTKWHMEISKKTSFIYDMMIKFSEGQLTTLEFIKKHYQNDENENNILKLAATDQGDYCNKYIIVLLKTGKLTKYEQDKYKIYRNICMTGDINKALEKIMDNEIEMALKIKEAEKTPKDEETRIYEGRYEILKTADKNIKEINLIIMTREERQKEFDKAMEEINNKQKNKSPR
ncbi:MAG TPA: hypothetical protein PLW37_11130, partial [bacterium]|nr:hypothetical protein [bacterium]